VEGQEIEKSEKLAQIFVMPDVVEDVQTRQVVAFEPDAVIQVSSNRQAELLREQQQQAQLESRTGRKFLAVQLLSQSQSQKVVLLGAPGSGKTTLMSYFAVMLAQQQPEKLGLAAEDWLPILIRIRDLTTQSDIGLLDYARQFAEKTLTVKSLPAGFFEYWLEDGRALILLDGLDEVAEEAKRYDAVKRIENFLGNLIKIGQLYLHVLRVISGTFFARKSFPTISFRRLTMPKLRSLSIAGMTAASQTKQKRNGAKTA
jgi:predicted NACHT family NTPase